MQVSSELSFHDNNNGRIFTSFSPGLSHKDTHNMSLLSLGLSDRSLIHKNQSFDTTRVIFHIKLFSIQVPLLKILMSTILARPFVCLNSQSCFSLCQSSSYMFLSFLFTFLRRLTSTVYDECPDPSTRIRNKQTNEKCYVLSIDH